MRLGMDERCIPYTIEVLLYRFFGHVFFFCVLTARSLTHLSPRSVSFDARHPERCFLYEKYDDRAAFDRHLASAHFKSFDATVAPWVVSKDVQTWIQPHS